MNVLIAEDDVTSRTILTGVMTKWGFRVEAVSDGDAAWAVMQRGDAPKLAIIDWNMPGMDGVDVCRQVRALETSEPPYIILLTARGDVSDIVDGLKAGANDFISKPYDNEELHARVEVGRRMLELQDKLLEAMRQMEVMAKTDVLTQAANRRAVTESLHVEISRSNRQGSPLLVAILDLDHFKNINDTHGHQTGDEVLIETVRRLRSAVRPHDHVGRWGGEEFLLLLPHVEAEDAPSVLDRIRGAICAHPVCHGDVRVPVSASFGAAQWKSGEDVDALVRRADEALYRAKEAGRNRVEFSE